MSWIAFCIFAFFARIGEATNPGPTQEQGPLIGCINPNGLLGKGSTIQQLPKSKGETIWAVSETHLTRPGRTKMAVELGSRNTGYNLQLGAEVPLKSNTVSAVGGKQLGVGFLSTAPCRSLTRTWGQDQWKGCRIHASCFQVGNRWIQGGVIYGIAAQTAETRSKTNQLCCLLEERLLNQSQGLRFIAGDFNQEHGALDSVHRWMERGWVNAQIWASQKLGKPIQPTCHGTTTKDHLYFSPELAMYLKDVHIDSTFFADHACVWAQFSDFSKPPQVPIWKQPCKINWAEIKSKSDVQQNVPQQGTMQTNRAETKQREDRECNQSRTHRDMSDEYEAIAEQFEMETTNMMQSKQIQIEDNQLGRCKTREVRWIQEYSAPPRQGRYGDSQPYFHGLDLKHSQWLRQLRRCENLVATLKQANSWDSNRAIQRDRVWQCIGKSQGFGQSFRQWWRKQQIPDLPDLPYPPPSHSQAVVLLREMNKQFRNLESNLLKNRIKEAKSRREQDVNYIFRDLKDEPPQPVQMLVTDLTSKVTEIDRDENAVVVEPPRSWDADKPIVIGKTKVDVIYAESDKLWLEDLMDIQPGQEVKQDTYVGELSDLFRHFGDAWRERWDRHLTVDESRWEPVVEVAKQVLPQPNPMVYQPISYEEWRAALKRKKNRSAIGPDGMAKLDLINMSRNTTERLLQMLTAIENGAQWPIQAVTGFVMALEKTPGATSVDQYRPITVFSLVFRTWGSIRARQVLRHLAQVAPASCVGNLPGKQTSEVWQGIQAMIEESFYTHTCVSGAVIDLVKAFNLLPRIPILSVMHHLNVAPQIIRGWSNALCGLRRRFKIRNAIGPALASVTGFAEGDALSVTAMLGANLLCHAWFRVRYPNVHMWSFVDNLEVVSQSGEDAMSGLEGLHRFAEMMDVLIDGKKTYGWSTMSHHRGVIRQSSVEIKYWARDLGGHMQYGQQVTNQTVASRCAAAGPLWNKLARSLATYSQKLRASRSKAYPRCLHAIQSVHLADEHFDRLRTGVMQGVGSSKTGSSPLAHLSLVEEPKNDPQYHSLITTVLQFRQLMHPDQAAFVFSQLSNEDRQRPRPGPCSVLLHRLYQVAWQWKGHTTFQDQMGMRCDIFTISPQELSFRLEQAWQDRARAIVSSRKSMKGLHLTNSALTKKGWGKLEPKDQALMRTSLNGTFFTSDYLAHRKDSESIGQCEYCGAPDSFHHRNWECEKFVRCRAHLSNEDIQQITSMAPCIQNHGWMPEPPSVRAFQAACDRIPDTTGQFVHEPPKDDQLFLFTDGGCLAPTSGQGKLAMWGVACGSTESNEFVGVANGLVSGQLQTVVRAEITAVISASKYVAIYPKPFWIFIDNELVYARVRRFLRDATVGRKQKDSDLWQDLAVWFSRVKHLCQAVVKVTSHQNLDSARDEGEDWIFRGNNAADAVATSALSAYPEVVDKWRNYHIDIRQIEIFRQAVHKVILQVGRQATSKVRPPEAAKQVTREARKFSNLEEFSLAEFSTPEVPLRYRIPNLQGFLEWFRSIQQESSEAKLVSWFHLNILFEHQQQTLGFRYSKSSKRWTQIHEECKYTSFVQRTNSLSSFTRGVCEVLQIPCRTYHLRPHSAIIPFWTQVISFRIRPSSYELAEQLFLAQVDKITKVADLRKLD